MEKLKILGQDVPLASTLTDVYTVPLGRTAVISSIVVCNLDSSNTVFSISLAAAGAADTPKQYIYKDLPLAANDTFVLTIGISLDENDVVRILSASGNVSFNLSGVEVY